MILHYHVGDWNKKNTDLRIKIIWWRGSPWRDRVWQTRCTNRAIFQILLCVIVTKSFQKKISFYETTYFRRYLSCFLFPNETLLHCPPASLASSGRHPSLPRTKPTCAWQTKRVARRQDLNNSLLSSLRQ